MISDGDVIMAFLSRTRRQLTERDLKLMMIPRRFWPESGDGVGISFQNISEGRHKEAVRNYLRKLPEMLDKGYGILFFGESGVGKTSLSCLIAHEARRYDATVFYVRSFTLRDAVIQGRIWDENITVEERANRVDLLIIDDMGKEHVEGGKGWSSSFFEDLIRVRSDNLRSTIIASSLSEEEYFNVYKDGMRSAMKESIWPIAIVGENLKVKFGFEKIRSTFVS